MLDFLICQVVEAFTLWEVLTDQAIGVFVQPALPGVVGMSEEALGVQHIRYLLVIGKLFSVVIGQSMNVRSMWPHRFGDRIADGRRRLVFCFDDKAEPALALGECDKYRATLSPDHGIGLPIPNSGASLNDIGAFRDAYAPNDLPPSLSCTSAFAAHLLTT